MAETHLHGLLVAYRGGVDQRCPSGSVADVHICSYNVLNIQIGKNMTEAYKYANNYVFVLINILTVLQVLQCRRQIL
jgi:hypothetical protein